MSGVRQALLFASVERYLSMAISFIMIAIVSRLLTPAEVGTSAIGTALLAICIAVKEFAASGFLIQGDDIRKEDVRTAFTVQFMLTAVIGLIVMLAAPAFAQLYGEPMLGQFIRVVMVALVLDTASGPIIALLRRDLAFGTLAIITVASLGVNAIVTVILALLAFSSMSVAWGWLGTTVATVVLCLVFRPNFYIFNPSIRAWRRALAFGGYHGAMTVLSRVFESLPQLVLGHFLPLSVVGLYNRATVISGIPDKFILSGLFNIAFPALAAEVRAGRNLKQAVFKAFCYITAFYWPALALMVLLAQPLVHVVLGQQWDAAVPLVRIMTAATVLWFPVVLTQPLLLAVGAMRDAFLSSVIALPLSALVLCAASTMGAEAMALSQFVTTPIQMYVALRFIQRHVPFTWTELAVALRPSLAVCGFAILPVLTMIGLTDLHFDLSITMSIIAGGIAFVGWLVGIKLTGHPVGAEISHVAEMITRSPAAVRLTGR